VLGPAEDFQVQRRDPATGEEATVALPALNVTEISGLFQDSGAGAGLNLEIRPEEAIAIMTIGSFGDPDIRAFLDDSFATLREAGIQDLVIDLRGNGGGGSGEGALLYSFLTDEPFRYYDHLGTVLDGPLTYLEHTDQSATGMDSILARIEPAESGGLRYPHWAGLDREQPGRPDAFAGNVYFLIDGGCGSSTTEFAAVAKALKRGVFVGEETGGRTYGNNSGTMPQLTLPNTGIVVIVPLFQFVMAVPELAEDRGILPDYAVTPTPEEFAAGVDTELVFTLDLIGQQR
jgi:C-terminal processing protease CtpA/Prc